MKNFDVDRSLPQTERPSSKRKDKSPTERPTGNQWPERDLFQVEMPEFIQTMGFRGGSRGGVGYRLMAWSALAAFIDGLILFSTTCFLALTMSLTAKFQMSVLVSLIQQSFLQGHLKYLFLGEMILCFFYLTLLRSFLGFTIGEWACGLRLGAIKQRLNRFYSLRVIGRTFLIFITGIISLPVISMIFGRDIAGWIVGLPLIEQNQTVGKRGV